MAKKKDSSPTDEPFFKGEEILLLPTPLLPRDKRTREKELRELLKSKSLEQIAASQLEELLAWERVKHPVARERMRNYGLAYSRAELEKWITNSLRYILNERAGKVTHGF